MYKFIQYTLLFCLLLSYGSGFAQNNGRITGTIKTADGEPALQATVSITGLRKIAAGENGRFTFKNIPAGDYTITASYTGLESQSKTISLQAGQSLTVNFILQGSGALQEVAVEAARRKKIVQRETENPARLPLKNLENPQIYNVVTSALFNQQIVLERTDLYYNIPGAVPNFSAGGSQGISQRGFSNTNGFRNGLVTSAIYPMNPAIIERVEVMKGPTGTLFGTGRASSFGGVYNYVTKRPFGRNAVELGLTAGSFNLARLSADVNHVLDSEGKQLLRVNAAWQSQGSFQDQGYAKNFAFAPSFSYQVNDKLKFLIEASITRNSYTTTSFALPANLDSISFRNFRQWKLPYERSLGNNSVDAKIGVNDIGAEAEYKISDTWKSQTKFLYSEGKYDHLLWSTFTIANDSTIARTVRNQTPETFGNIELQQNFIGDFKIAGLRNRMVLGLDYNRNYYSLNRATVAYDRVNINKPEITDFNKEKIDALSAGKFAATTFGGINYAAYASDVLNITPQLMAMASLRVERYTTKGAFAFATGKRSGDYQQTALSPKFGLVYQVLPEKLSVFANYMNGFANLAPAQQSVDGVLEGLKPQYANQLEGGIKYSFLNERISGSLSYYDIKVSNSTRTETVSGQVLTLQDGTQRSRGLEFDLTANPITGLNIVAGYAYNQNKYEKASPALTGKSLMASPKNVANFWASYVLPASALQGLGIGAGGNYVSDSWFDSANRFTLPGYTLVNATVFYEQAKYRVGIKANNIGDKHYWNPTGMPQNPRNLLLDLRLKF
ncbi:iron complex outermembrane receptor protein [Pedobacter africanus]|uniref:TonB-dependent siderophore receptor n=1 Tax=Pedobacter africanus TaxID=151894 RepID=A0ACC6KWJ9_9SPHI|nr:TonB-dependent receptor [Pedobacter africanus]MDR6783596.1 TonB-dependent siderophore receptor [Pedobacter africanus]